jgi:putative peptide zinc metalloprotease protein
LNEQTDTEQLAPAALLAPAPAPIAGRVRRRILSTRRPPKPAPGLELLGEMEDSGFEQTPFLVRRADGQVVQLPELLFVVLEAIGQARSYNGVARYVTERFGAEIEPDDARFLVDEKLKPLGLVGRGKKDAPPAAAADENGKPGDDLLALTWKARIVPEGAVRHVTTLFKPLFAPVVVVAAVAAFIALLAWFVAIHGIAQPVRTMLYDPALLVFVFAGVIVATAFHEIGHATACRYGGARPGVLGIGLYVIWPVFYTDVTDAYRLGRGGRLRTDLGGIYFNSLFALACGAVYFKTHWEPVLLLVMVQTFTIIQQLLPLGRLDGYLILTDLTGVPDLLSRMKPILSSMIPGRGADERVKDLKPWVRRVATGYIALLIPVLLFIVAMMLIHAPRVMATAYDSIGVRWDNTRAAFSEGRYWLGGGDLLQCAALVLPALGMTVSSARIGKRLGGAALAWSAGAPVRRAAVVAATVATAGTAAYTWMPNGDYRPIQPNERGTLQAGIRSVAAIPSGRPALTAQQALALHGAPSERYLNRHHERNPNLGPPGQNGQPGQDPQTMDGAGHTTGPDTTGVGQGGTTGTTTGSTGGTTTGTAPGTTTDSGTTSSPGTTDTGSTPAPADSGTSTTPTTTDTGTSTTPTTTDTGTSTTPTTTDTTTSTTPTTTDTTTTPTP